MMCTLKQFVFFLPLLATLGCSSGSNSNTAPITPTITWATPAAISYGVPLSSTQLDASAGGVAGTFVYTPAAGTVLTAGAQTLSVTFYPSDPASYTSATASVTLTVNKAAPVITWIPNPLVVGSALGSAQLNASAGSVAGSFVYSPPAGTVMSTAGTTTLNATFTPTDTADYTSVNPSATLTVLSTNASNTATVDFGTAAQTIRGFGGSTAWMPELSTAQADTLFGTGSGQLGLSILRVRIDPSSTTGGSNWATELANAQAAQAANAAVNIIATPWTPPAAWKSNNNTVMGSLNTSEYASFAGYLNLFTSYLSTGGVDLYGISMQNEPDANVTYESCVWTGAQMDTWVADNASVLTTRLIMPESESFTASYSDPALDDSSAVGNVSIIAGHIYGVSPSYYTNAENKGKDVWMTEHYLTPSGAQPAIADALAAAKEINDSMSVAGYNAYLWWWVADWNPGTGVTNYGLIDTNGNPTFYGYAIGQYSRFVRPGYVRSNATYNPGGGGVYVTAYNGAGHFVIVALNLGATPVSQQFQILNQSLTTMTPYQTSSSESITQLSAVTVSGNTFTYALPAQSITTFVY